MKPKQSGVTLVEILVVLGIIAILASILIPATQVARNMAKTVQQKGQFASIGVALESFKGDYGDYPPSAYSPQNNGPVGYNYSGAQQLAEALVGRDLRGFSPSSRWNILDGAYSTFDPNQRRSRYLDVDNARAFLLQDLVNAEPGSYGTYLAMNTYVLCDTFGRIPVQRPNQAPATAGFPILYYRADTSGRDSSQIYDSNDCSLVIHQTGKWRPHKTGRLNPLTTTSLVVEFGRYIQDSRMPATPAAIASGEGYPCRPDSYLLISAGPDGEYGNKDDVCNFEHNY